MYWFTAICSFFVTDTLHYSPSGSVHFGQDHLLCHWTCTALPVVPCHSGQLAECLPFSSSFISFFKPFSSSMMSASETFLVTAESSPLKMSSSWCGCHYRCYAQLWGLLIFRILELPYPVVVPCLVPCAGCMLPCMNSRLLPSCCVNWSFGCQIRWLPYSWTIGLLKLM